jgi:hypothetical protein
VILAKVLFPRTAAVWLIREEGDSADLDWRVGQVRSGVPLSRASNAGYTSAAVHSTIRKFSSVKPTFRAAESHSR